MNQATTPFTRGAQSGMPFGTYLTVIFLGLVLQNTVPLIGAIGSVFILCLPVVTFVMLRRSFRRSQGAFTVSEMWVEGIAMYLFGSAICGLVTFIYLKWIDPGVMVRQIQDTMTQLQAMNTPESKELARIVKNSIREGFVITPSSFVQMMAWSTMLVGLVLSFISAVIIRIAGYKPPRPTGA